MTATTRTPTCRIIFPMTTDPSQLTACVAKKNGRPKGSKIPSRACKCCGVIFTPRANARIYCCRMCFYRSPITRGASRKRLLENPIRPDVVVRPWDGGKRPDFTGEKHPMWGKRHSEETRLIISRKTKEAWDSGNYYGESYKLHARQAQKIAAKKRPNYRGGISPLHVAIRGHAIYKAWRKAVFARDNFTCCDCGVRGGYLEAHHTVSFSEISKRHSLNELEQAIACAELWDISNGKTLCKKCHVAEHGKS